MKPIIITICATLLIACAKSEIPPEKISDKFLISEKKLGLMLDELDDTKTAPQRKTEILCGQFQKEYTEHYMPNLIEYNQKTGGETSEQYYLNDLKNMISGYKKIQKIDCAGS